MAEQYANGAQTTLASSLSSGATSLSVVSALGFPTLGTFRILIDSEILRVTAVSGTTWTVSRASEPMAGVQAPAAHNGGATVTCVLTAASLALISLASIYSDGGAITSDGSGNVTAVSFSGDGSGLTGINASPTIGGAVNGAAGLGVLYVDGSGNLQEDTAFTTDGAGNLTATSITCGGATLNADGSISFDSGAITSDGAGNVTAVSFTGDGSGLTGITAGGTTGQLQWNNAGTLAGDTATTDGSGNLVVTTISNGVNWQINTNGSIVFDNSAISSDGSGGLTVVSIGDGSSWQIAATTGAASFDNGKFFSDGSGGVTATQIGDGVSWQISPTTGAVSFDSGTFTSDGSANIACATVRISPISAPGSPVVGQIYYDSGVNHFYGYTNLGWQQLDN